MIVCGYLQTYTIYLRTYNYYSDKAVIRLKYTVSYLIADIQV